MNLEFMDFGGLTHGKLLVTPSIVTCPRIGLQPLTEEKQGNMKFKIRGNTNLACVT